MKYLLISLFSCLLLSLTGYSQQIISGKVTNEEGRAAPGVNITVKNSSKGTRTDDSGRFQINVRKGETLLFSSAGYQPKDLVYDGQREIAVRLQVAYNTLDEVVAVGYGTVTKKEITGSVSTVKAKDFNQGIVTSPMGLIQGKVPGLTITKAQGGDPNQGYQVQLRGLNTLSGGKSPLIIVDGIVGDNTLNMIDPNEIESIDVLKDGSAAAIYGTRATNGVVLITTKKAAADKVVFEINTNLSTDVPAEDNRYLTASEYRDVIKKYYPTMTNLDKGASTDWFKQVTRTPLSQRYSFSASGGTKKLNYRANLFYKDDQGLVKNTRNQTLTPSLFISQTGVNDRLKIDYRLMYSTVKRQGVNSTDVLGQAARRNPTMPVYDSTDQAHGGYYTVTASTGYLNPVAMINEKTDDLNDQYFSGDINASFRLLDGLKLVVHGNYNSEQTYAGLYKTRYYPSLGMNGYANASTTLIKDRLFEPGVDYHKTFSGHSIQAVAGYSYYSRQYNQLSATNSNFDLDDFTYNNIGAGAGLTNGAAQLSSSQTVNKLISFYGRVIYNYLQRYLFAASVRQEGSSRFGANNKWGTFPAVSAGWVLSQEEFMKNVSWISNLKLRAGVGVTGNQDIPEYLSLSRIAVSDRRFYYDGNWVNTYQPASNPNPDLKWEKKTEYNVGVDFGILKNRLSGSIDYYTRRISDLLWYYSVPVPPNVYNNIYANVGKLRNQGIEIALNWQTVKSHDLNVNMSFIYSQNRNKLLSFSDANKGYTLTNLKINPAATTWTQLVQQGQPIGNFVAPVFLGVDAQGKAIYKDIDKNGSINVESETDRQVVGNAYPKFELGWTTSVQYKAFDASFFFRGVFGHSVLNYERIFYENWQPLLSGSNILRSTLKHADYKGIQTYDSRFVEKASFVKLNNMSIGYNLTIKGMAFRVFATGQNLFTITNYSGIDPEVPISNFNTDIATDGGENLNYYPYTKTFSIGFNYKF